MEQNMNENYEIPKTKEITSYETRFFRVVDPKNWHPNLSVGPFLPITSSGDGNLPYKMDKIHGSTIIDNSQKFILI